MLHYNSHSNDKPQVDGEVPPNLASGKGGTECRDVPDNAYFDGRVAETAIDALLGRSAKTASHFSWPLASGNRTRRSMLRRNIGIFTTVKRFRFRSTSHRRGTCRKSR